MDKLLSEVKLKFDTLTLDLGKVVNERDDCRKVLQALYDNVPAIGHHDIPAYDCQIRQLAKAMNQAAKTLGHPEPYKNLAV